MRDRFKNWILKLVEHRTMSVWLFIMSFTESSFFPIPPDFLLMPAAARFKERWVRLASIVTCASVLGGLFGYLIGAVLFDTLGQYVVNLYSLHDELEIVSALFKENAFLAIFTAAFTPIPYKLFTISAGLFGINIPIFIIASILGRGIRFYIESFVMARFGAQIGTIIYRYFNALTAVFAVLVIIYILIKVI